MRLDFDEKQKYFCLNTQERKVIEELQEMRKELAYKKENKNNDDAFAEECFDLMQATYTMLKGNFSDEQIKLYNEKHIKKLAQRRRKNDK